jgi:hypothetical protein
MLLKLLPVRRDPAGSRRRGGHRRTGAPRGFPATDAADQATRARLVSSPVIH